MVYRLLTLVLLVTACCACGPTVIYEDTYPIPDSSWTYADSVRFDFDIPSTERAYDLVLTLEHAASFPTQNFYVKLHTDYPSGKRATQELSLQLAGKFGAWLGDCGGETCTQEITILRNARFETTGKYGLTVEQFTRTEALDGIAQVGLSVREHEQ